MAGLIRNLPPRSSRESDKAVVSKARTRQQSSVSVKGGGGLYEKVSTITSLVNSKLGKYKDEYLLLRTESEVIAYFDKIIEYGYASIDTETSSLDTITTTLAGICLYVKGEKPCYIPVNHVSYITGVKTDEQVSSELITEQLNRCKEHNVKWIMHNAKFDIKVLRHTVNADIPCYWDTMLASRCMNENERASLKDLHLKYCDSTDEEPFTYDKLFHDVGFPQIPINTAYLYAAGDAIKTWELYEFQNNVLQRESLRGVRTVFMDIEMEVLKVVCNMEDRGIELDKSFAQELSDKYNNILKEREEFVYNELDNLKVEIEDFKRKNLDHKLTDPINISSPTQVAIILYDILGIGVVDDKKKRGTGEDILLKIDTPFTKALLEYRETSKLLSTYIDNIPKMASPKTGRIHCSFNQYGADTGRFSSSEPNMQNIPSKNKEIRRMFTASEGYVLVSCDFSQQEPRILADRSQDEHFIQAYADGKDVYAWVAEKIYKVPYEECKEFRPDGTKNPDGKKRRDSCKSIILGIMYGRGVHSIAEQLGCSRDEAQSIIDMFYREFPKIKSWMDDTVAKAREQGFVETIWGRKRRLPDMKLPKYEFSYAEDRKDFDPLNWDTAHDEMHVSESEMRKYATMLDKAWSRTGREQVLHKAKENGIIIKDNSGYLADAERQCVNSIIQGSSADVTKLAMIAVGNDKELIEKNCHIILQVHDEIILECPKEHAKFCADRVCQLMMNSAKEKVSVPMKVDAEVTVSWYGETIEI